MRPSDEEKRHRNLEDFDSISEQSQNNKPGLIHTKWRSRTGNRWARSREPQRDLPHKSKKNSQEQRCVRHSVAWLQYHIGLSNDQKFFSEYTYGIFILGTSLLDRYELKFPRWKVEGQLVKHSRDGLQFHSMSSGLLCNSQKNGHNSLLGGPYDM